MPRETVTIKHTIGAPIDRVWAAVSAIGGLDQWFPMIETCRVEGSGVGARRICGLANGAVLHETVTTIDHAAKRFQYTIADDSPLPVSNYLGTVTLAAAGGGTVLTWTAAFDVDDAAREEMAAMLQGALGDGVQGMAKALEAAG
jgi:uncharacterized protein YndB with AHSA1/START domain